MRKQLAMVYHHFMIVTGFDWASHHKQTQWGAYRGAQAKAWMASQSYNVLQRARDKTSTPAQLHDIAMNGTTEAVLAVISNRSTELLTLESLLARWDNDSKILPMEVAKRLVRNKKSSRAILELIHGSQHASWWDNRAKIESHPNW